MSHASTEPSVRPEAVHFTLPTCAPSIDNLRTMLVHLRSVAEPRDHRSKGRLPFQQDTEPDAYYIAYDAAMKKHFPAAFTKSTLMLCYH